MSQYRTQCVINSNLLHNAVLLTPGMFDPLRPYFLHVYCTHPIGGASDLSNRRKQNVYIAKILCVYCMLSK